MNKLTILIVCIMISYAGLSQITIDQNDMPQEGDTIRLSTSIDFGNINFEETGNNFEWDFSELTFLTQRVDTFISVSQTPWIYQLVFLLSANLASPGQDFDQLPGFEVSDYFNYYKNSSSQYKSVGFGVTMNSIPVPNKFDDPDVIFRFPMSVGDVDSSLSNYDLGLPGIGYYGGWKKRVNTVDGWGELTTPYGTFETIRIKSDIMQYDSLYIDSLGFGFPIERIFTEYKWLGKNFGLPLCTVVDDGLLPTIEYLDSARTLITGITPQDFPDTELTISPNPFDQQLKLDFFLTEDALVDVSLYGIDGNKMADISTGFFLYTGAVQSISINNLAQPKGIYLIRVKINDEIIVRKLISQ